MDHPLGQAAFAFVFVQNAALPLEVPSFDLAGLFGSAASLPQYREDVEQIAVQPTPDPRPDFRGDVRLVTSGRGRWSLDEGERVRTMVLIRIAT